MIDQNIKKTLEELREVFKPEAMDKLQSHLYSLLRKIEDLTASRDSWKRKYQELEKKENKNKL